MYNCTDIRQASAEVAENKTNCGRNNHMHAALLQNQCDSAAGSVRRMAPIAAGCQLFALVATVWPACTMESSGDQILPSRDQFLTLQKYSDGRIIIHKEILRDREKKQACPLSSI